MSNSRNKFKDDEVDMREIFLILWRGKFFIALCVVLAVALGSYYLRITPTKYTVYYKLKRVSESPEISKGIGGLGGLASLAGIQLPAGGNEDFYIFTELLLSVEVSEKIIENESLIKKLFESEWNEADDTYSEVKRTGIRKFLSPYKKILTGRPPIQYTPPNAQRLVEFITKNIDITQNAKQGFLTLRSETVDPETLIKLIVEIANTSDYIIREKYKMYSKEPLSYYKEKIRLARSREHREALATLIGKEEQKLMLASSSKFFVAEPIMKPVTSLYPTYPKPILTLLTSFLCGLLLGSFTLLILKPFKGK